MKGLVLLAALLVALLVAAFVMPEHPWDRLMPR